MIKPTIRRWPPIVTAISVLTIGETISFLLASLLHLGIPIWPGFSEPRLIPATIVEGLCGLFLGVGLYTMFANKTWAWRTAATAHVFAILGVLLGIYATRSFTDEANFIYHRVILVVLVITLALLVTPGVRATLGRKRT